jgi:SAM-dependent methyltransferase
MDQQEASEMKAYSLLKHRTYTPQWVRDFYDQSGIWWGAESDPKEEALRVSAVERKIGPPPRRILELGAGFCFTAAVLAERGYDVTAIDLSPVRVNGARNLHRSIAKGPLTIIQGDFYTAEFPAKFDGVCYWDGFGIGTDDDQRKILRRIAEEWLLPGGSALIDVANTVWAVKNRDTVEHLGALPGVPGSVEMNRRSHFDPLSCRWIDEWEPVHETENALSQTVRCYTVPDFVLLLHSTGLELSSVEAGSCAIPLDFGTVTLESPLNDAYSFLAHMVPQKR